MTTDKIFRRLSKLLPASHEDLVSLAQRWKKSMVRQEIKKTVRNKGEGSFSMAIRHVDVLWSENTKTAAAKKAAAQDIHSCYPNIGLVFRVLFCFAALCIIPIAIYLEWSLKVSLISVFSFGFFAFVQRPIAYLFEWRAARKALLQERLDAAGDVEDVVVDYAKDIISKEEFLMIGAESRYQKLFDKLQSARNQIGALLEELRLVVQTGETYCGSRVEQAIKRAEAIISKLDDNINDLQKWRDVVAAHFSDCLTRAKKMSGPLHEYRLLKQVDKLELVGERLAFDTAEFISSSSAELVQRLSTAEGLIMQTYDDVNVRNLVESTKLHLVNIETFPMLEIDGAVNRIVESGKKINFS
ncbi:MAG: hypothetical protein WC310_02615 [Patescibacteria group bacterium]|jgi:hypothetical protein